MTTIDAVYRDGVFHPTSPVPFAEGATVRVTVQDYAPTPIDPLNPADVLARIVAISALTKKTGKIESVSGNVDEHLYGKPGDSGDVR